MRPETQQQVAELNTLLQSELGSIPGGSTGNFAWKWSEDLWTLVQDADPLTQQPVIDYHCACGVNPPEHQEDCKMVVAKARTRRILVAPQFLNRWLLCRWIRPPAEATWKATFGSMEDYPRGGTYVPFAQNNIPLALKPATTPDSRLTWTVIHAVRSALSTVEVLAQEAAKRQREEDTALFDSRGRTIHRPHPSSPWWQNRDAIRDRMTTFGQKEGTKGAVSYPSVQTSERPN